MNLIFNDASLDKVMNRRERETIVIKEENMSDNEGAARPSSKRRRKTYGIITSADAIKV